MKKQILALFLVGAMIFGSASAIFAEKSADNVVAAINDGQENRFFAIHRCSGGEAGITIT